jgi:hypothetical protein
MDVTGMITVIFFFVTTGTIAGSIIFTRHRERMNMIERGMKAEEVKSLYDRGSRQWHPLTSLKWGIITVGIGLAVLLGMWLTVTFHVEEGVYPGLIALFGGVGLILFYLIAKGKDRP